MIDDTRHPPSIWAIQTGIQPHDGAAGLWSDRAAGNGTEYVRADLARARVAAAYEDAAYEGGEVAVDALLRQEPDASLLRQQIARQNVANAIRALTPADASAALDRLLAEARAQEREACAALAESGGRSFPNYVTRDVDDAGNVSWVPGSPWDRGWSEACNAVAAAIRASDEAARAQEGDA